MDDIHEDPELGFSPRMLGPIRAANSEPTLCGRGTGALSGTQDLPALSIAAELVVTSSPGRRQTLVMTTGRGRPKAYSFDGVNPNLPVPFKAKFRYRKTSEESSNPECLGMTRQDAEFIKSCAHPPCPRYFLCGCPSVFRTPAAVPGRHSAHRHLPVVAREHGAHGRCSVGGRHPVDSR
ncbi:unnamed protein product [Ixodes persulcatus]